MQTFSFRGIIPRGQNYAILLGRKRTPFISVGKVKGELLIIREIPPDGILSPSAGHQGGRSASRIHQNNKMYVTNQDAYMIKEHT